MPEETSEKETSEKETSEKETSEKETPEETYFAITRNWSRFHHKDTDTEFTPILDVETGCWIGAAQVDAETAEIFDAHPAFEVLDADDYASLTIPAPAPKPAEPVGPSETGDPLGDAAKAGSKPPPAPPAS